MDHDKPADAHTEWQPPKIVEVGGVTETTGWRAQNVRDNQGDTTPLWTDPTRSAASPEIELPDGE